MTATPKRLLRALDARDGHVCAFHGPYCETDTLVPNHRANRGHGGRPSAMVLENLIWVDSALNGLIESDARWAREATRRGIKISSFARPADIPVRYADGWYLLTMPRTPIRDDEAAELMALHGIRTEVA